MFFEGCEETCFCTIESNSVVVNVFKGEIFGGINVESDSNDGEILMRTLGSCCSCSSREHASACSSNGKGRTSVLDVLSTIKGPWAVIYWQVVVCAMLLFFFWSKLESLSFFPLLFILAVLLGLSCIG